MIKDDIEIGVKIKTHIYLNLPNNAGCVPFDVDRIVKTTPTDKGAIITMAEVDGFSSHMKYVEYEVENDNEKIIEAINDAIGYKKQSIDYLNSILEK